MTTLYLATTGGHLAQLVELADRFPRDGADGSAVWVTHANEQSTSLLAGRDVEYVPYVGVRNVPDVARTVPRAHDLHRRRRITRAVSTGSGIALAYLPYLAARGVECHYIESAARVEGPSLTGRLMRRVPRVRVYSQYPHWAGGRWRYGGSVLDSYRAVPGDRKPGDPVRVVVTVGTAAEFPFRRLIAHLAGLLGEDGPLARATGAPVEVLWQTGCTPVDDLPIQATPFLPARDLEKALADADVVVTHAGTGSALATLGAGRCPVLAVREERFGEAGDDHQGQLADELVRRGLGVRQDIAAMTAESLLATVGLEVTADTAGAPVFTLA